MARDTNTKIRLAMRANERAALARVKRATRLLGYYAPVMASTAWHNALDRLVAKRLVRRGNGGYVPTAAGRRSR